MGQKEKGKSEQKNAKKESTSKSNNIKPEVKNNLNVTTILLTVIIIIKAGITLLGAYQVYKTLTSVPAMPDVDLNAWWGPNETDKGTSIRPYKIVFSDSMQSEIRTLFEDYRRNDRKIKSIGDSAWTYGVNSEAFGQFFAYWLFTYKFSERVKFLNQFDHFITNVQGLDVHFLRVKPEVRNPNVKVLPLLLLHGWPGSVREFYEAIQSLTKERPGYDFVFEIIAPSLPGFAFSDATSKPGLNPFQIAIIMRNLMQRLGFTKYYIQGGDFGHLIGSHMATIFPKEVLGFHTTFPANFSKLAHLTWILGAIWPTFVADGLVDRMYPLTDKIKFYLEESGYMHLQGTKPDTIGIVLQDSPVGLAAYILDRFMIFTDPNNKFEPEGGLDKYYSKDKLLDNIMLYWATGSIMTAMRLYKESFRSSDLELDLAQIPTPVPTWVLRSKNELIHHPDFILRWKYTNLVGTTNLGFGGHFFAFERPEEFADDVFKAVKSFSGLDK